MGLTSLPVCMDSAHWLQEAESSGCMLDSSSSSPSAADMLASCTRPPAAAAAMAAAALMDAGGRRLRPPHDHPLKCPRCESTHTKFCYYNNYSLSQPRYFCKTCRRYWTKGGTLRNIPVGGGCRKNKKPSSSSTAAAAKKSSNSNPSNNADPIMVQHPHHHHQNYENATGLTSPFSHVMGLSHFAVAAAAAGTAVPEHNSGFLESKYGGNYVSLFSQNPSRPIDFLDSKFDLMGVNNNNNDHLGMVSTPGTNGDHHIGVNHCSSGLNTGSFQGIYSAYGAGFMDTSPCQRLMLTSYDHHNVNDDQSVAMDVKPNPKLLSLDWQQDQGCSDAGKEGAAMYGGYINGLGPSWNGGLINGYGSATTRTNSLL